MGGGGGLLTSAEESAAWMALGKALRTVSRLLAHRAMKALQYCPTVKEKKNQNVD
ncbi:hypothetical protein STEG23_004457, partial [Scotinomys teguina]